MPKIGDALKKAVEQGPADIEPDKSRARPSSALMNANRRRIFQYLCLHPCSVLSQISRETSMSRSSAMWHLESLAKSGYIMQFMLDGKPHYCPKDLVSRKNLRALSVLAKVGVMDVYLAIQQSPGSDVGMMVPALEMPVSHVRRILRDLEEAGLITRVADGRNVRYFATDAYKTLLREETHSRKEFLRTLMKRLSSEHLKPEIENLKGSKIIISMQILAQREILVIPGLNLS
jgi:DNA-binding transcriptional ArsR family regulator